MSDAPDNRSSFDPGQLDMTGKPAKAFAVIGDTVYVETPDGSVASVVDDQATALPTTTPDEWLKFNGGYAVDPTPEQAAAAEQAVQEAHSGDPSTSP